MKKSKLITAFFTLSLAALAVAGCGKKTGNAPQETGNGDKASDISNKVDLVVGGLDRGNSSDDPYWPTTIVEEMEKKLNINLKMVNYDQQKLGLDLASGELPDVMLVYRANSDSVIRGRHAVALNKYFDTIGKDMAADRYSFRNSIMAKYQSGGDKNVYFTTPSVTVKGDYTTDVSVDGGYAVRWDLYKKIGAPIIDTPKDYIDAMKKMRQLYPKTPDGLPTYCMSLYNDVGLSPWIYHGMLDSDYANLDGNMMYILNKDTHEVSQNVISPNPHTPFWNDMHFYNEMWKEGLLDPDCFITKGEDLMAKYTKGQYLGGINNWYYGDYNKNVRKNPDSTAEMVLLPCHDIDQGGYFPAGWNDKLIFVSSHSKNKNRAIMFLDYINSEEFARLQYSGVEGINWKLGDDGKPSLTEETIDMKNDASQSDAYSKLGLSSWVNWGGLSPKALMSDGSPASLWVMPDMLTKGLTPKEKDMCKTLGVTYPSQYGQELVKEGKRIDNNSYDRRFEAIMPALPQDVARIDGSVVEIVTNALPGLVQAKDDAAFLAARNKLIADVKATRWINPLNGGRTT